MPYAHLSNRTSILILVTLIAVANVTVRSQGSDHTCGTPDVHNPNVVYGQVTDIDGNVYKTIVVDSMIWFAENLKATRFQNGDTIPNVSDAAEWSALKGPGMCSYQNDPTFDCPYGKLYNYYVATDERNPCPAGWRVPSMADFRRLINYYDVNANGGISLPNSAGGFLKSAGTSLWRSPNTNATNTSGFSGIPSGGRNNSGAFSITNNSAAAYWSTSLVGPRMGFFLELAYPQDYAVRNAYWAEYGSCIRCVTDMNATRVEEERTVDLQVNPNPASETIQIDAGPNAVGKEYHVFDVMGRPVLQGTLLSVQAMIPIGELSNGTYVIRFPTMNVGPRTFIKR